MTARSTAAWRRSLTGLLLAALLAPPLWMLLQSSRALPLLRMGPAAGAADRLVIVLPGIQDDLDSLRSSGVADAIRARMPQAEIVLVGAGLPYYLRRNLVPRLEAELVAPAGARGIRRLWLVGASLGGFGALLYERSHPGEAEGLVLLAPFTGRPGLGQDIADAGGLARWIPGTPLPGWHPDQAPRSVWAMMQDWSQHPGRARRVWLACGSRDPFLASARLIGAVLPPGHALETAGGHRWSVWAPATAQLLSQALKPPLP